MYDLIVVGAGASGIMAAGRASELGAKVLLLEKMEIPGRKLRITGKGRCNITNMTALSDFLNHIHPSGKPFRSSFSQFFSEKLIKHFDSIGVKTVVERGERVFPESNDANKVTDALIHWCKKNGVEIKCGINVKKILSQNQIVNGVEIYDTKTNKEDVFLAKNIIIATGGKSYPATGSTGDGYNFGKFTGHTIITPRPALVPLISDGGIAEKLQGLSLKNVKASIWINGSKKADDFGEMLFTHFGLSGPIILTLSRLVVDNLLLQNKIQISIDLKPALEDSQLDQRILRDLNGNGKKNFDTFLKLLLPQKLIDVCCNLLEIANDKKCHQISTAERKKLRIWLKDFRFNITGHRGFKEAIITAGGVDLNEIDTKTFQSKKCKNLYFVGEVIDADADTGGFNLQIAFTSGWVAGEHCAKSVNEIEL